MKSREWKPGDPCKNCGSIKTHWNPIEGAWCESCGKADSDE